MRRIAVGDVMTRNFVSTPANSDLLECAKQMVKTKVDSLLITDSKRLVGILTARDILWTITKNPKLDLKKMNVMKIATKKVAVIKPSADIAQALRKMKALNFKRLPVISKGEVIGVITIKDILRFEPSLYPEISELMQIREEERKLKEMDMEWPSEGFCDNCGTFSELLRVDNVLLCPDCREELY